VRKLQVRYTIEAAVLIRRLHPEIKRRIREGIRDLLESPFSGHALQFDLAGFRSLRVRSHRIIFRVNNEDGFIEIYYVGHRRDVYESFRSLLLEKRGEE
jgi:mRNA interferase RelE/StbE